MEYEQKIDGIEENLPVISCVVILELNLSAQSHDDCPRGEVSVSDLQMGAVPCFGARKKKPEVKEIPKSLAVAKPIPITLLGCQGVCIQLLS